MREIKFRAWDEYEEKLLSWEQLLQINYSIHYLFFVPNHLRLQQYTGLKDKNGKEIYEGDIIKIIAKPIETNFVEFRDGECRLSPHGLYLRTWHSEGEVIGNIYENPELLEVPDG